LKITIKQYYYTLFNLYNYAKRKKEEGPQDGNPQAQEETAQESS
jgi:hypothetical protein